VILPNAPSFRFSPAVAYDGALHRIVLHGGYTSGGTMDCRDDTWQLSYRGPTPDEHCTLALDADLDGLAGCADPDCADACSRCGDGTCDVSESCHSCPADCTCSAVCGDFHCDPGEDCTSCPGDCC
jgi:hypothetical protein